MTRAPMPQDRDEALETIKEAEGLLKRLFVAVTSIAESGDAEFMQDHACHHVEVTGPNVWKARRALSALARSLLAEVEREGLEAAANGMDATHNPYTFVDGKEAQRDAWARGCARVWDLVGLHARRAADAAAQLSGRPSLPTYAYQGMINARHGEPVTLLGQVGRNVMYLSKTGHVCESSAGLFHKCFTAVIPGAPS